MTGESIGFVLIGMAIGVWLARLCGFFIDRQWRAETAAAADARVARAEARCRQDVSHLRERVDEIARRSEARWREAIRRHRISWWLN